MENHKLKVIDNTYCTIETFEVFTVYLENVPQIKANFDSLHKMFYQFGAIKDIQIENFYKIYTGEVKANAVITFVRSDEAYKAICAEKVDEIEITFADSWKQPTFHVDLLSIPEFNASFMLDQINDDCLFHIYSFLQLQEQLKLAQISYHQKSMLRTFYRNKRSLNISNMNFNQLNLHEIRTFFIENGDIIENLNLVSYWFEEYCPRLFIFALKYCTNVKVLETCGIHFKYKSYSETIANLYKDMKVLRLNDCRISNKDILNFTKLTNIEVLDLSGSNNDFNGSYFYHFKNLKELQLQHNCDFLAYNFLMCCENFHNLAILNIIDSENLHIPDVFDAIVKNCQNLEWFKMSIFRKPLTGISKKLSNLPKLKGLTIHNSNPRGCANDLTETLFLSGFLIELTKTSLSERIETLEFPYCIISEDNLIEIGKIKKLNSLLICLKSNKLTEKFWIAMDVLVRSLTILSIRLGTHDTCYKELCMTFITILLKNNYKRCFQLVCDMSKSQYRDLIEYDEYKQNQKMIEIIPFYSTNLPTSYLIYEPRR